MSTSRPLITRQIQVTRNCAQRMIHSSNDQESLGRTPATEDDLLLVAAQRSQFGHYRTGPSLHPDVGQLCRELGLCSRRRNHDWRQRHAEGGASSGDRTS